MCKKMCKKCDNQSGNVACFITIVLFIVSLGFTVAHIVKHGETKPRETEQYGEIALYSAGVAFISWVVSASIKKEAKNTKIHPIT